MSEEYEKYLNLCFSGKKHDKYHVTRFIDQGGNGFVYECKDEKGKEYVVKILHDFGKNNIKSINFKKEIDLQYSLNSPYVIKCIDSGNLRAKDQKKDRPFYVMKKYDTSLEQMINNNDITPIAAYKYSMQLCEALKEMHKRKEPLIHRDLKPENILYDKDKDIVVVCDFGLTHVDNGNESINEGFVGNVDYHAPEQKKRGNSKVGTYTDIYSLGLIINVLFTKEIPTGENYKKIWECAPYFQFIDHIIEKMIQHDYSKRESDINVVLKQLKMHEMEYEVEESFLKAKCSRVGVPLEKVKEVINLFSLSTYFLKNDNNMNNVNLNYSCDYHFCCNSIMKNSILVYKMYKKIKNFFEAEKYSLEMETININKDVDKEIVNNLNSYFEVDIFREFEIYKERIIKYFMNIFRYHALEYMDLIPIIKEQIEEEYNDSPILYLTNKLKNEISDFGNLVSSNFIELIKYEVAEVEDKNSLFVDNEKIFKDFAEKIREKIKNLSYFIEDDKIKIFFDTIGNENKFEELLKNIIAQLPENDVRRADIMDIIEESVNVTIDKIYVFDLCDVKTVLGSIK